jgi:hypothetical protein
VALKSNTAAEKSKDQLSRDFLGRSIFDFCNNIGAKQTLGQILEMLLESELGISVPLPCSPRSFMVRASIDLFKYCSSP